MIMILMLWLLSDDHSLSALIALWPWKMKIDSSAKTWTERTDGQTNGRGLALLDLLSEPKLPLIVFDFSHSTSVQGNPMRSGNFKSSSRFHKNCANEHWKRIKIAKYISRFLWSKNKHCFMFNLLVYFIWHTFQDINITTLYNIYYICSHSHLTPLSATIKAQKPLMKIWQWD